MMAEKILVRPTLDPDARVSTGVPGLDDMLEGGFPAGSLITLAGRPGTGKTIFGSQFLYQGARDGGEPGMYVSMLEGRKAYFRNMTRLGLDLPPLEKKNLFRFLEMPTLSAEGLPAIWEEIVGTSTRPASSAWSSIRSRRCPRRSGLKATSACSPTCSWGRSSEGPAARPS